MAKQAVNKNMAKPPAKKRAKYDDKLAVYGSFLDIMKASVKDANNKRAAKK